MPKADLLALAAKLRLSRRKSSRQIGPTRRGRLEAAKNGLKTYYPGPAGTCKRGHDAPRYTGSAACIVCERASALAKYKAANGRIKTPEQLSRATGLVCIFCQNDDPDCYDHDCLNCATRAWRHHSHDPRRLAAITSGWSAAYRARLAQHLATIQPPPAVIPAIEECAA